MIATATDALLWVVVIELAVIVGLLIGKFFGPSR